MSAGTLRLVTTSGRHGREVIGESVTIEHVGVATTFRRRGFATRLMHAAEQWLRANPDLPQTLTLGVETTNTPAIALYQKLGYAIATEFSGPSGNPCYAMFKRLE